ncbi:MAG: acylphosphatase [Micrococcaceae bacterium]
MKPVSATALSPTPAAGLQPGTITIAQSRGLSYRVPGTRQVKSNYIVQFQLTDAEGATVMGIGEGQPRAELTADYSELSWSLVEEVLEQLEGRELTLSDPAATLDQVRGIMVEVDRLAHERKIDPVQKRPFRGTMLAIESALLDAFARALGVPLFALLGRVRDSAPGTPAAMESTASLKSLRKELLGQRERYEWIRINGTEEIDENVDFLEIVATVSRSRSVGQADKPLWLEMHGALDRARATEMIDLLATSMLEGHLPRQVLVEQPVMMKFADHLPKLQKRADERFRSAGRDDLDLVIMGDESIWDQHSLGRLRKLGGLRAINIRPAQAGGLLESIALADLAVQLNPDTVVTLTRMAGASRITSSLLRHLAVALPQVHGINVAGFPHSAMPLALWEDGFDEADDSQDNDDDSDTLRHEFGESTGSDIDTEYRAAEDDDEADDETSSTQSGEDSVDVRQAMRKSEGRADRSEGSDLDAEIGPLRESPRELPGNGLRIDYTAVVTDLRRGVRFPPLPAPRNEGRLPARYPHFEDVRPLGPNGTKGYLLEKHALARGLSITRYSKSAFAASDGVHPPVTFKWSRSPVSSAVAISVCTHKEATRLMLEQAGVPTPQGRTFRNGDFDSARRFVDLIGFPVVVKPSMGIRGIGVIAGIETPEQLEDAFTLMSDSQFGGQDFIVEKHVRGRDHRILVVGGEVVGAIQRKPASAHGDGRSTIAELLINRNVARRSNPHLWTRPAKFDGTMAHQLERLGLTLDSVLPEGEEVMLSNTANISQGADSIDVFDTLHPSIIDACQRAVAAIPGMQYCGVDFLLEDPSKALDEQDAAIIELNAHAAIGNCEYPMFGTGRPVAEKLMELTIAQRGLEAHAPVSELTVHLTIRGRVSKVGFRSWLRRHAEQSGLRGWVRRINRRTVEAVLHGPTNRVTPLVAACVLGPGRALPESYDARVIPVSDAELTEGFEVREQPDLSELSPESLAEIEQVPPKRTRQNDEPRAQTTEEPVH